MLLPCTLRPRRGRHAAAVVQKTIKKLIPRGAGLLFLILFSVKLERERKLNSLDFEFGCHFATHSSSKRISFSPPLRPLDRTKEYERTTPPKEDSRNPPRPRDPVSARKPDRPRSDALKLHSGEPVLRRFAQVRRIKSSLLSSTDRPRRQKRYVSHISCPCLS